MSESFVIELPAARAVSALALVGFDFGMLDVEHSPLDFAALGPLITEAQLCEMAAVVRLTVTEHALLGTLLDLGADG